jgi:hypothetical protein
MTIHTERDSYCCLTPKLSCERSNNSERSGLQLRPSGAAPVSALVAIAACLVARLLDARELPRAAEHGEHFDASGRTYLVHDPIRRMDHFPHGGLVQLGDDAPGFGKRTESLDGFDEFSDCEFRLAWRGPGVSPPALNGLEHIEALHGILERGVVRQLFDRL